MTAAVFDDREIRLRAEFDVQVGTLVRLGYPQVMGLSRDVFVRRLVPLADIAAALPVRNRDDRVAFVLVIGEGLIPRAQGVGLTQLNGRSGFTSMEDDDLKRFTPRPDVDVPADPYLLVDVDTGPETLNVVPDEALRRITAAGRMPLTIDEGLAVATHVPGILRTHNCFSMLASRCGDRRVPALWVSKGRPRLGWCWAAAPHTWLGSASCAGRIKA